MPFLDAEAVCRICYDGPKHGDALFSNVCACKGTIGYIHRSCAMRCNNPTCTICAVRISTSHAVVHECTPSVLGHVTHSLPTIIMLGVGVCCGYGLGFIFL